VERELAQLSRPDPTPTSGELWEPSCRQSLKRKFGCALVGCKRGLRSESNFFVHFFVAAMVVAAAAVLGANLIEWCLLVLCIAAVLAAEMFNCAVEHLAKAITREQNKLIGTALDISSAGVLVAALGAAIVGILILGNLLAHSLGWW
jgi:diacylglycerol kinase